MHNFVSGHLVGPDTHEVIDLTDEEEGEGVPVVLEEIGGPIEYVWTTAVNNHPSNEVLEQFHQVFSPIPEEDYNGLMAVADREVDILVHAGTLTPEYENPPVCEDPPRYQSVDYCLDWGDRGM